MSQGGFIGVFILLFFLLAVGGLSLGGAYFKKGSIQQKSMFKNDLETKTLVLKLAHCLDELGGTNQKLKDLRQVYLTCLASSAIGAGITCTPIRSSMEALHQYQIWGIRASCQAQLSKHKLFINYKPTLFWWAQFKSQRDPIHKIPLGLFHNDLKAFQKLIVELNPLDIEERSSRFTVFACGYICKNHRWRMGL